MNKTLYIYIGLHGEEMDGFIAPTISPADYVGRASAYTAARSGELLQALQEADDELLSQWWASAANEVIATLQHYITSYEVSGGRLAITLSMPANTADGTATAIADLASALIGQALLYKWALTSIPDRAAAELAALEELKTKLKSKRDERTRPIPYSEQFR